MPSPFTNNWKKIGKHKYSRSEFVNAIFKVTPKRVYLYRISLKISAIDFLRCCWYFMMYTLIPKRYNKFTQNFMSGLCLKFCMLKFFKNLSFLHAYMHNEQLHVSKHTHLLGRLTNRCCRYLFRHICIFSSPTESTCLDCNYAKRILVIISGRYQASCMHTKWDLIEKFVFLKYNFAFREREGGG